MRLTPFSCPICASVVEEREFYPNAYECTQCNWIHYLLFDKATGESLGQPEFAKISNERAKEHHRIEQWRKWWGLK